MSAQTVFKVDGVEYRAADLAELAGVHTKTILKRHREHPDWGYEQLVKPSQNPIVMTIEHDGKKKTLKAWASELGVPYQTARERWKKGIRQFDRLFCPYHAGRKEPPGKLYVSREALDWLTETRYARAGMPDEWEIACDLIGVSRFHAGTLRGLMA